jgi:hypothetical protein
VIAFVRESNYNSGSTHTQLALDTFNRANENPLDSTRWSPLAPSGSFPNLQIVSDTCEPTVLLAGEPQGAENYTGITWPNDQYAEVTVLTKTTNISNSGEFDLILRSDSTQDNCYDFAFIDRANGTADVLILVIVGGNSTALFENSALPFSIGDVFRAEALGSKLSFYQNGVLIGSVTDTTFASGIAGLYLAGTTLNSDIRVSNFSGGLVSAAANAIFPLGNSNGNLIVIGIFQSGTSVDLVTGVTDTEVNNYFRLDGAAEADSFGTAFYVFWAAYVTNGSNGLGPANVLTILSASPPAIPFQSVAAEYSGVVPSNPEDTSSGSGDNGTNTINYILTLALTQELIISMTGYQGFGQNWSALSGTPRAGSQNSPGVGGFCFFDTIANLSGPNTVSATDDNSGGHAFPAGFSIALIPFNPNISGPKLNYGMAGSRRFGNLIG